ncbi:hypothetical protein [Dactylosporangium sp. CA-092794]|uniref:hypothetical protein n=1 Tax=Dactylosporangium sp. CA-092794 TaxID=3239929 RepID=UPI003D92002D
MQITLANYSRQEDSRVQAVLRSVNQQINEDFQPYWSTGAQIRLGGRTDNSIDAERPVDLAGDAILYLLDDPNDPTLHGVLGYHEENQRGTPFGFVFTDISAQLGEDWSVTLSHEALELIGDANVNKLAAGPDPRDPRNPDGYVLHWFEMCDAVQAESYEIDGIAVSNFVTPLYFTIGEQEGGRNDYLSLTHPGGTLRSFGVNPGGYVGFLDPRTNSMDTFAADKQARQRLEIKSRMRPTRRGMRYTELPKRIAASEPVLHV